MLFNSLPFLIFFPVVAILYFVFPKKIRNYWLLIASYYFYMSWNPKYILLLLSSTVITYCCGLLIENIKRRDIDEKKKVRYKKLSVILSLVLNLAILFYFKYTNFLLGTVEQLLNAVGITVSIPEFDILLPVGISFYTFQALGYTIDVYRDEIYAEKNFFKYALFVSFFPQLVAGPIERSKNLLKQLSKANDFDYDKARSGLLIMLWGFFLKIGISDPCSVVVNTVYNNFSAYNSFQLITATVFFAFQIYCDFWGYSEIAKGAARVLGYELIDNFDTPYFSCSIREFWHRWHISLSTWFRDYLYIPLGGSRCSKVKKYRNILIVFLVSGLWHGASWTFVLWGLLHGVYQVIESVIDSARKPGLKDRKEKPIVKLLKMMLTFVLADFAWIFFRAQTVGDAFSIIKEIVCGFSLSQFRRRYLYAVGLEALNLKILLLGFIVLVTVSILRYRKKDVLELVSRQKCFIRYPLYWLLLALICLSSNIASQTFIYFQF